MEGENGIKFPKPEEMTKKLKVVCSVCGKQYGEKPSVEDGISHGYCPECFPKEMERMKEASKMRKMKEQENKE